MKKWFTQLSIMALNAQVIAIINRNVTDPIKTASENNLVSYKGISIFEVIFINSNNICDDST